MPSVRSTAAMVEREGDPIVIKRASTPDLNTIGFIRNYDPAELVEDIIQGDRQVIISNEDIVAQGWPGPPRRNDQIMIEGKTTTVTHVKSIRFRGDTIRHDVSVRG